jgi:hypothetical protein
MSTQFSQGHACVIGVGADLPNTIQDAQGIADILSDLERCAYPSAQVQLLTGEQSKREDILTALDRLASSVTADSTVVIYFSGHGYQFKSDFADVYYLMPFGYDMNRLKATAISGGEFAAKLKAIPAQKLLVLLDCCHAGGLSNLENLGMEAAKAPLPPEAEALFAQGHGRVIIASSKENEVSLAGRPYSAFTAALIEGLCGVGVAKLDGYVRVTDLALHTREVVPQRTRDRQHPILNFEQADNFVLAYYAGGDEQPKGLPFEGEPEVDFDAIADQPRQVIQASGDRSVAIGGAANNSMIVTGDGNVVGTGNVVQRGKYNLNLHSASNLQIGDTYYADPQSSRSSRANASGSIKRKTILVLAANPTDLTQLALGREVREIEESLHYSGLFEVKPIWAVRHHDLRRALLSVNPHIVHFCGHGVSSLESDSAGDRTRKATVVSDKSDQGGIFLEDESGSSKLVKGQALTDLLALFTANLECVVLNSCYSEEQAALIVQHVPVVIGMKQAIGDKAAIEFSRGFYDGLRAGRSLDDAFKLGRNAIDLQSIPEHLTPVIKHRDQESKNTVQNISQQHEDDVDTSNVQDLQVGDRFNLQGSQGAIVNPGAGARVTQQFGNTTNINTEGGDYAGGDLSK